MAQPAWCTRWNRYSRLAGVDSRSSPTRRSRVRAAAAIARWTEQGKQIVYCLVTSGEKASTAMAPAPARLVREAEQRAAAAVVGVEVVEFLGQPDGSSSTVCRCGARWHGLCAATGRRS